MNIHWQPLTVTKEVRAALKQQRPCVVWLTGLSGAGKSTIANLVEGWLALRGCHTYLLDGDNVRHGLNKDLGFTAADRVENIRRVGEVARLFVDAGVIVICSFISPFRAEREAVRGLLDDGEFIEIHVTAPLEVCERRDPKGPLCQEPRRDNCRTSPASIHPTRRRKIPTLFSTRRRPPLRSSPSASSHCCNPAVWCCRQRPTCASLAANNLCKRRRMLASPLNVAQPTTAADYVRTVQIFLSTGCA